MSDPTPRPRRLDEMAGPGWVGTMATLLRGAGIAVALLLLVIGFFTGGFFIVLTAALAVTAIVGGFVLAHLVSREAWYERPSARAYSVVLLVALPVVLVLVAQLAGPALTPAAATSRCFEGSLTRDQQQDMQLAIDPRIASMEFRLRVPVLEDGALRWWATDPAGDIQWGGRAEDQGFSDVAQPAAVGGQWTVSVRSEAGRAEYQVEWLGALAGEPLAAVGACDGRPGAGRSSRAAPMPHVAAARRGRRWSRPNGGHEHDRRSPAVVARGESGQAAARAVG